MKYLVKRDTKEHQAVGDAWQLYDKENYYIVEADSEGWIKHEGDECPLPDDSRCDAWIKSCDNLYGIESRFVAWGLPKGEYGSVMQYRPILAEDVQEPEPYTDDGTRPEPPMPSLFEQLDAAHQVAAQIPDIVAQIKARLEQYGYTVVSLNPFVPADSEPDPAAEAPQDHEWSPCSSGVYDSSYTCTRCGIVVRDSIDGVDRRTIAGECKAEPTEDMSDWRNWREGDWLLCAEIIIGFRVGNRYRIGKRENELCVIGDDGMYRVLALINHQFRFHSRPAKGEK